MMQWAHDNLELITTMVGLGVLAYLLTGRTGDKRAKPTDNH